MSIDFMTNVVVRGPGSDLRKAFPFLVSYSDNYENRITISGSERRTPPFSWDSFTKDNPNLVVVHDTVCDTSWMSKIFIVYRGVQKLVFDQELEGTGCYNEEDNKKARDVFYEYSRKSNLELITILDRPDLNGTKIPITDDNEVGFCDAD